MSNWKKNRKTVNVKCKVCGVFFDKIKTEFDRIEKTTGNHYCSRSCCGKDSINNKVGHHKKRSQTGQLIPDNRKDEFTGFREFLRRARNRDKLGDLTLVDLKNQWKKQNGMCPYCGINLKLPSKNNKCEKYELASLDRIDSNKLYERNNIMFVSTIINYMKSNMSESKTIDFCKKITKFWKDKCEDE